MTTFTSLSVRNIYLLLYLWGGSRWPDSEQRSPDGDDHIFFAFCEKYLFYALPVRWQSLTGQWAKGSSRRWRPQLHFLWEIFILCSTADRTVNKGLQSEMTTFASLSVRNIYSMLYLWGGSHCMTGQWAEGSSRRRRPSHCFLWEIGILCSTYKVAVAVQ